MTDHEPPPYAEGAGVGEPTPAKAKDPRRRKKVRLWVALVAGVLGILCAGGAGVAVLLYDEETKIERTAPDAVVDNFLRAYLVNRDDKRAALYRCDAEDKFREIAEYRADIVSREKQFSVGITVSWATLAVTANGSSGIVATDLTKTSSDLAGRVSDSWQFEIVDQNGWRVCGAKSVL